MAESDSLPDPATIYSGLQKPMGPGGWLDVLSKQQQLQRYSLENAQTWAQQKAFQEFGARAIAGDPEAQQQLGRVGAFPQALTAAQTLGAQSQSLKAQLGLSQEAASSFAQALSRVPREQWPAYAGLLMSQNSRYMTPQQQQLAWQAIQNPAMLQSFVYQNMTPEQFTTQTGEAAWARVPAEQALERYRQGFKGPIGIPKQGEDNQPYIQQVPPTELPWAPGVPKPTGPPSWGAPPSSSMGFPAPGPQSSRGPQPAAGLATVTAPQQYQGMITEASARYEVPEELLTRMLHAENGFRPTGTSPKGAKGIAQFMPETAKQYGVDPNDPRSSIMGAAHYLSDLYKKSGTWTGALAGYLSGDTTKTNLTNNPSYLKSGATQYARMLDTTSPIAQQPPVQRTALAAPTGAEPAATAVPGQQFPRNAADRYGPAIPANEPLSPTPTAPPPLTGPPGGTNPEIRPPGAPPPPTAAPPPSPAATAPQMPPPATAVPTPPAMPAAATAPLAGPPAATAAIPPAAVPPAQAQTLITDKEAQDAIVKLPQEQRATLTQVANNLNVMPIPLATVGPKGNESLIQEAPPALPEREEIQPGPPIGSEYMPKQGPPGSLLRLPYLLPGQKEELDRRIAENAALGKDFQSSLDKSFTAAKGALTALQSFRSSMGRAPTGIFASANWLYLKSSIAAAQALGTNAPQMEKEAAAYRIMESAGKLLGFDLVKSLGSREAVQVVQQVMDIKPNIADTPASNRQNLAVWEQAMQRVVDKHNWMVKNIDRFHGDWVRADQSFETNQKNDWLRYSSKAVPVNAQWTKDNKPDTSKMVDGVTYYLGHQTKEGDLVGYTWNKKENRLDRYTNPLGIQ